MTCYFRATKTNLRPGHIVIRLNEEGIIYGPLLICSSFRKEIQESGMVSCSTHLNNGLMKSIKIPISELARVIDYSIRRKLKPEEKILGKKH